MPAARKVVQLVGPPNDLHHPPQPQGHLLEGESPRRLRVLSQDDDKGSWNGPGYVWPASALPRIAS